MASLARSTVFNGIGSAAMLASGFLTTVVAGRILGPEAVGVLALAAFVVSVAIAVLDLGLPGAMSRYLPELDAQGRTAEAENFARRMLLPYAGLTLFASVGLYFLLLRIGLPLAEKAPALATTASLIAVTTFLQSLGAYHYGVLKGRQRFDRFSKVALLSAAAQIGAAIVGSLLFGVAGALAAPLIGFCLPALLCFRTIFDRRLKIESGLLRRTLAFAGSTWLIYILTTIAWSRTEVYFLSNAWGNHAAGLFASGLNLANLAVQAPLFLTGALVPYLVTKRLSSPAAMAEAYAQALRYFALLVFPATFGAAAITPSLLPTLYGPSFADAVPSASLLIGGAASMAVITITQQFAFASERTGAVLWLSTLAAALSILSGLTLTSAYGLEGAALGRVAIQVFVAMAMLLLARRWGWRSPLIDLARIALVSAGVATVAGLVAHAIPGVVGLLLAIAVAIAIYVVLIPVAGLLRPAEVEGVRLSSALLRRTSARKTI
jgi:O-antigen/teichoic acid export membrane protein